MKKRRSPLFPPSWIPTLTILLIASLSSVAGLNTQASPLPFHAAETIAAPVPTAAMPELVRRQGCISDFYSCSSQGSEFADICCQNGQACTLDSNNQPACCPSGAVCTGTAPATFLTPSSAGATQPVSYVPNSYFSFPYIVGTSFSNAAACTSAARQCAADYAACTAELQSADSAGAGYGVTIVVPGGGGITVGATLTATASPLPSASASSICASLSSAACFGLQSTVCAQYASGGGSGSFFVGSANAAARPTPPPPVRHAGVVAGAVAAGVGLGMMRNL